MCTEVLPLHLTVECVGEKQLAHLQFLSMMSITMSFSTEALSLRQIEGLSVAYSEDAPADMDSQKPSHTGR